MNTKATSLDQLSRTDKDQVKTKRMVQVDIQMFYLPKEYNIRYAGLGYDEYWKQQHVQDYVEELAKDYAAGDIFPPIVVKFDAETQKAIIVDGAHRYFAILMANEHFGAEIIRHVVIESKGEEAKNIFTMIKTGDKKLDLGPVEIAEGIARLENFGHSVEEIAKKLSKTVQYVYYMRKVNDLPIDMKIQIRMKKITLTKALAGDKPKKYNPPKKTVCKILDLVAGAEPEINGDSVKVDIPLELYKQLFDPCLIIEHSSESE